MIIDEKTRYILTDKLNFTNEHISILENNAGQLARIMNLMSMIQRSPGEVSIRKFVKVQLDKIRQSLDVPGYADQQLLLKARAEYYTFQRSFQQF